MKDPFFFFKNGPICKISISLQSVCNCCESSRYGITDFCLRGMLKLTFLCHSNELARCPAFNWARCFKVAIEVLTKQHDLDDKVIQASVLPIQLGRCCISIISWSSLSAEQANDSLALWMSLKEAFWPVVVHVVHLLTWGPNSRLCKFFHKTIVFSGNVQICICWGYGSGFFYLVNIKAERASSQDSRVGRNILSWRDTKTLKRESKYYLKCYGKCQEIRKSL